MTTNSGMKVSEDEHSLTVGDRGPTLLEDFHFREKMMHFDHERIPEHVVHARGFGAHGEFQVYEDLSEYTSADFLTHPEKTTPVFVRFSTYKVLKDLQIQYVTFVVLLLNSILMKVTSI